MSGPVVALCGLPGSGKTSLALALSRRFGWPVLHYDDYETATAWPIADLRRWVEAGCDYARIGLGPLPRDLAAAASDGPVLLDTLLGRAHPAMAGAIDLAIWIDTPADVALARKVAQAATRARRESAETAFAAWLEGWLSLYGDIIAGTYRVQEERVRSGCEIVIDGRSAAATVAGEAAAAIEAWLRAGRG